MAMTMEQSLLAQARPHLLAAKARALVAQEVAKGCLPDIAPHPVELEPPYARIGGHAPSAPDNPPRWTFQPPSTESTTTRLQVWVSPQQPWQWQRSELLLKQLAGLEHRLAYELVGNQARIDMLLMCHPADLPVVQTAFQAEFECCVLTPSATPTFDQLADLDWHDVWFLDVFPPPPYSHLMTRPEELTSSPYATIITALAAVQPPALGLYQALLQPVSPCHDWHHNVERLLDLEFSIKLMGGMQLAHWHVQQAPSGDLRQMAGDVASKAHNDKPFFAAALRLAVIGAGPAAPHLLRCLGTFKSLIQHGGRPLDCLTHQDYQARLSPQQARDMFCLGLAYRPGFLLNSWELTALAHIPPPLLGDSSPAPISRLETLPPSPTLLVGTPVGTCSVAGHQQTVCIPPQIRRSHVHLIGRTGMGKSSLMEAMAIHDIEQGHGIAVLDPHGLLVERLLCLVPPQHAQRVILLDPGDHHWVPLWNPLNSSSGHDRGRIADDIVAAFRSFVSGWGDRLEHLLRHAIHALLHLEGASLLDVSNLLRKGSPESEFLRRRILRVLENQSARRFWRDDFDHYGKADLAPPQHKLSKLLASDTVSLMLSQPDNAIDLRQIMDHGQVLLVNLSGLGSETRNLLGCFLLALLHQTALARSARPVDTHTPYRIYCDEAHRFVTDALEDLIAETRKFNVSLTLAHQHMSQFPLRCRDALSSVGSTIIFKVDIQDAQHLTKDLQGRVEAKDLVTQTVGQAIARIDTDIVRLQACHFPTTPQQHCHDQIIQASRLRYCKPRDQVQTAIRQRLRQSDGPATGASPPATIAGTGTLDPTGPGPGGAHEQTVPSEVLHYEEF